MTHAGSLAMAVVSASFAAPGASAADVAAPARATAVVQMAELQVEPARLDAYLALLREEVATSARLEPGVLALNAVMVDGAPGQVRLLEVYADQAAYDSHLRSPHFLKYKTGTADMVISLTLLRTTPILLCGKSGFSPHGEAHCLPGDSPVSKP